MNKVVVLSFGDGDWEQQGFPVTLQIREEGEAPSTQRRGSLPPDTVLPQNYEEWQLAYRRLPEIMRLDIPHKQVTNVSKPEDCRRAVRVLEEKLKDWLNSESFSSIKDPLQRALHESEQIRVIIETEDFYGKRLPWHLWDFFEQYPQAELSLSTSGYDRSKPYSARKKVRILAILGNSEGIKVEGDRKFLESLPGADTVFLVEPPRREISEQLWEQDWDILFFAGHSSSDNETGTISINPNESLTLGELKNGLRKAIEGGLQLAIFNSCDGLGLARELQDLGIPQVIVMREPVPDKVAQEFLKYFLTAFAKGQSLYLAVRKARERLHDELEKEIPGVTWLPVICQNPTALPMVWPKNHPEPIHSPGKVKLIGSIAACIAALSVVTFFVLPALRNSSNSQNAARVLPEKYKFVLYENATYGIKIEYPKGWEIIGSDPSHFGAITGDVAKFVSPKADSEDPFQEYVLLSVEPLDSPTSLDEHTKEVSDRISKELADGLISLTRTKLANNQASAVVYTQKQEEQILKTQKIWTLKNNQVYMITYTAEEGKYSEFEPTVKKMIESFEID